MLIDEVIAYNDGNPVDESFYYTKYGKIINRIFTQEGFVMYTKTHVWIAETKQWSAKNGFTYNHVMKVKPTKYLKYFKTKDPYLTAERSRSVLFRLTKNTYLCSSCDFIVRFRIKEEVTSFVQGGYNSSDYTYPCIITKATSANESWYYVIRKNRLVKVPVSLAAKYGESITEFSPEGYLFGQYDIVYK